MAEPAEIPSFQEIFVSQAPYVGRALRYLGIPARELPDACQEVFVVVHRRLSEFRPGTSLRSWIYAICVNMARLSRRTARRHPEDPSEQPDAHLAVYPIDESRLSERRLALEILDGLDDDKRVVFVLHEIEQLTMAEIAAILECPLQTGYSRLRAAREQIAQVVARLRAQGRLA